MDHRDIEALMQGMAPVIRDLIVNALKPALERISVLEGVPRRGEDGKDGKDGAPGLNGKDGTPGLDGKDGAPGLDGKDGAPGQSIEGRPGRDAIELQVLRGIDETRSYSAGLYAHWRGGVIKSERETSPIKDGDIYLAGWSVVLQGIDQEFEETIDDGRTIIRTTTYTSGKEYVRKIKTATPLDQGIWREGSYEKGDMVSWAGSGFIAQRDTKDDEKPGASDAWRLFVKRGRDGQDGKVRDTTPKAVKV